MPLAPGTFVFALPLTHVVPPEELFLPALCLLIDRHLRFHILIGIVFLHCGRSPHSNDPPQGNGVPSSPLSQAAVAFGAAHVILIPEDPKTLPEILELVDENFPPGPQMTGPTAFK